MSTSAKPMPTRQNTATSFMSTGSTSGQEDVSILSRIRRSRSRAGRSTSAAPPQRLHIRTTSSSSSYGLTTPSPRGRSASAKRSSTSGTFTQVGRHGNDWLFGGFSFTGAVKAMLSPSSPN